MPLNVADAAKAVSQEAEKRNSKIVEKIPRRTLKIMQEEGVYIFNVSPLPHKRNLGSLGSYFVPPCGSGEEVSEPLKISGQVLERITNDMNKMDNRYEEGEDVANDVMMRGRGYTPDLNMENRGLFVHDSSVPPREKIDAAKKKLHKWYSDMIARADNLEKANKREEISNTPIFALAAAEMGVVRPWCSESKSMSECGACGGAINPGVRICIHCKAPTDPQLLDKWMQKQYNPVGRPQGS